MGSSVDSKTGFVGLYVPLSSLLEGLDVLLSSTVGLYVSFAALPVGKAVLLSGSAVGLYVEVVVPGITTTLVGVFPVEVGSELGSGLNEASTTSTSSSEPVHNSRSVCSVENIFCQDFFSLLL